VSQAGFFRGVGNSAARVRGDAPPVLTGRSVPFEPTRPFRPARGLSSPHAQTIFASLARRPKAPPELVRERWTTADSDFIDVDRLKGKPRAPRLLLLHGLEGSSRSGYIVELLKGARTRGWSATALNFRSCSGTPNLLAHAYSSGDYTDPLHVLQRWHEEGEGPVFAIGFSLGGNVLLKMLGEAGDRAKLTAAVAVSVPYDLQACVRALDTGRGVFSLYLQNFLRSMREKALHKARAFPDRLDAQAIAAIRTIGEIDERVTAPLYGFANAAAYYAACSSGPWVEKIRAPTLLISADDDPLAPSSLLPAAGRANPHIQLLTPAHGGHVGFVDGSVFSPRFWAEEQALAFLDGFEAVAFGNSTQERDSAPGVAHGRIRS
jgi:uncharacterized protein